MTAVEDVAVRPDADVELIAGAEQEPRTQWQMFRRRFLRHKAAMFSLVLLIVVCVACFGASVFAPYKFNDQSHFDLGVTSPSWKHIFGTDELGRDYLSEVLYAGRISLKIGIAVGLLSTVVGVAAGAIAGFVGKWVDNLLMRLTDLFLVVPAIAILALAIRKFGQKDITIILVLVGLLWMTVARVVRGQVLALREKEFVEAARASGASGPRIVLRHILPNMVGPIMVNATLGIAAAVITEATLSFLGFGIQPPQSSWGKMLSDNEGAVGNTGRSHLILFPGMMLLIVVLCVNFIGDGLRDAFDPQAKH